MEKNFTQQKKIYLKNLVETAYNSPNKEIKTEQFVLCYDQYRPYMGYYITDNMSKYIIVYIGKEETKNYLCKRYGQPTKREQIKIALDYLNEHKNNLTKKQKFYIDNLAEIIKNIKI